jgi:hypothetical protein
MDPILNYHDIRFDESGRPYYTTQSGQRSYLPPAIAGQSGNPRAVQWAESQGYRLTRDASGAATGVQDSSVPTGGFTRSRGEWNPQSGQYDQGLNMSGLGGAILGGATVAPMALGALGVGPLATAAGGSGASGSGAVGGTELGGWLPSQSMGASMSATPMYPTVGAGTAAGGVGATAGASGGLSGVLKALTGSQNLPSLIGLGTSLMGGMGGGGTNGSAEADRIKAITEARMRRADPLHQMAVNLAASRMPTNMQLPVPNVPLPERK